MHSAELTIRRHPIGRDILLLGALSVFVFFGKLGSAPLWDRDEPRNAGCTAEMLAAGEYVVPIFNDELRTHKPIMLYWLMMFSYSVFGAGEFGARAVSAGAGVGTVLLTYGIGRTLFGRKTASWAGLVLSTTLMFGVASRAATPDGLLILCNTLAIYCFVRGSFSRSDQNSISTSSSAHESPHAMPAGLWLIAMYASMGLGVLVKGPVGLVLPTAVIGMFFLIVRLPAKETPRNAFDRLVNVLRPFAPQHFLQTCWYMRPLTALAVALTVALPWYLAVHWKTAGVWTAEFFWTHNVSRASATMEGHAGPPVLFYVAAILVGFFPWSILAIPAALQTRQFLRSSSAKTKGDSNFAGVGRDAAPSSTSRATLLLLCWIGVYVGLFSLAQTKLPSYVTPCYPAIALLVGRCVRLWCDEGTILVGWLKLGLAHWIVIGTAWLIAVPWLAQRWLAGGEWLACIGGMLLLGGVLVWRYVTRLRSRPAFWGFAVTAMLFTALLLRWVPAELGAQRKDGELFALLQRHSGPVVALGHLEPSWIFYGGKPIREFGGDEPLALRDFLASHPNSLVITTDRRLDSLRDQRQGQQQGQQQDQQQDQRDFLQDFAIWLRTEYFLRNRDILVLSSDPVPRLAERRPSNSDKPY